MSELWKNGVFPLGQTMSYCDVAREASGEARERDRVLEDEWNMVREAAECHRQVRKWAQVMREKKKKKKLGEILTTGLQTQIKPGVNLYDLCESLEDMNRKLVNVRFKFICDFELLPFFFSSVLLGQGFGAGNCLSHRSVPKSHCCSLFAQSK